MQILREVRIDGEGKLEGITKSGKKVLLSSPMPRIYWSEENHFDHKNREDSGEKTDIIKKHLKKMISYASTRDILDKLGLDIGSQKKFLDVKDRFKQISRKTFIQLGEFYEGIYLGYGMAYNVFSGQIQPTLIPEYFE